MHNIFTDPSCDARSACLLQLVCSAPSCLTLLTRLCPCWTKRREAQLHKCWRSLGLKVWLLSFSEDLNSLFHNLINTLLRSTSGEFLRSGSVLLSLSGSSRIRPEAPSSFTAVQSEVLESLACEISLPAYPASSLPWTFSGKQQGRTAGEQTIFLNKPFYVDLSTLLRVNECGSSGRFYKGVVPLWMRQIPYTMMKFACFERTVELLYKYVVPKPRSECSKPEQLVVTFVAGYIGKTDFWALNWFKWKPFTMRLH